MWRRIISSQLSSSCRSSQSTLSPLTRSRSRATATFSSPARHFSSHAEDVVSNRVEDIMPIATGHEREELQASLEGRDILEIDHPVGPFGTKEEPAIVKSVFDRRIVGCPGGEGEDEHDVVWFWLEKNKLHECPVCSQYFMLEVVGTGGDPYGHGSEGEDDEEHL